MVVPIAHARNSGWRFDDRYQRELIVLHERRENEVSLRVKRSEMEAV